MSDITIYVDNTPVSVPPGTLVVDAAKRIDVDIPVFCYHPKLDPVGMCRMCLVEIGRPQIDRTTGQPILDAEGHPVISYGPKLETGCTVPVSPGMHVRTTTPVVTAARRDVVEFILTSHPLDCPICDKGGECPLQNLTIAHGPGTSRFLFAEKMKLDKHVPLGDLIFLDRERCIQCARCTRFQDEIADDRVIGFYERGRHLEIVTFSNPGFDSYWSGNTTDICPVGALTTADFRFNARPWELKHSASLCTHCPVGCNTDINYRRDGLSGRFEVKRIMPRQNEQVNEIWLCDKGRFGHHYATSIDRLTTPLINKRGTLEHTTWDDAYTLIAEKLRAANGNVVAFLSERLANEDLYAGRTFIETLGGKVAQGVGRMGGGDLVQQIGLSAGSNLADLGSGDTIVVVASDLEEEAPLWWLRVKQAATRRGATLIALTARPTKLDAAATHIIRYTYGDEVSAVQQLATHDAITQASNLIVFYGSDGLNYAGTTALAQACANLLIETGHTGRANNGLVAVWPYNNTQGAWDMGVRPAGMPASQFAAGAQVIFCAAADPIASGDDLPADAFVIVIDLFGTATAQRADVVLPAQSYLEYEGTFTNGERRVQRFYPALPPTGQTRPTWQVFQQLAVHLGQLEKTRVSGSGVFLDIARHVPAYAGLTYQALAQVAEQFPLVGGADNYYGGTSYKNTAGLGVQLPAGPGATATPVTAPAKPTGDLLAASITTLYNRDPLFLRAEVMHPRIPAAHVRINPTDASKLGLGASGSVTITLNGHSATLPAHITTAAPQGIVLVPQQLGGPAFRGLTPVTLHIAEATPA